MTLFNFMRESHLKLITCLRSYNTNMILCMNSPKRFTEVEYGVGTFTSYILNIIVNYVAYIIRWNPLHARPIGTVGVDASHSYIPSVDLGYL